MNWADNNDSCMNWTAFLFIHFGRPSGAENHPADFFTDPRKRTGSHYAVNQRKPAPSRLRLGANKMQPA